jgi:hypothetical protein
MTRRDIATTDLPPAIGGLRRRPITRSGDSAPTTARTVRRSRQEHAMLINAAWQKSVEGILETGKHLIEAKEELAHGEFENMIEDDLLFSSSMARKLMKIGRNRVLVNREYIHALPPHWPALYELTFINDERLKELIENFLVHSGLDQKEAHGLRDDIDDTSGRRGAGAPHATARPAAESATDAWSQHDQEVGVADQDDTHRLVEDLTDEIAELLDPLRQRIEQVKAQGGDDDRAALADALRELRNAVTRLVDDLSPAVEPES